jgi:sugar (pentulose or hexulose) kinase
MTIAKKADRQVIRESKVAPADIVAIGCDSQWSVVVPVDEHAEPLMRAVHWMDTRGGWHNCHITAGFPSIQGSGFKVPFFALRVRRAGRTQRSGFSPDTGQGILSIFCDYDS